MGEGGAPVCPGWVSKMFDGHCHQLFDASHGGPDQRLVRPLVNTLRTEHQDGQAPGGGGVYSYLSTAGDCSRGRIHQATSRLVGFRVVRCHGRKPWLGMWLCAVVSEKKTAAAQCTGQRRVVRPQGESPGCVLTFRRVFCCHFPPPPTPFPCTISPRRPKWSHTGFPKSLQVLSGRSSDQRSSLQKPVASCISLPVEINRSKVATAYTVSMACGEPFIRERFAMGTLCLGNVLPHAVRLCVSGMGSGGSRWPRHMPDHPLLAS